MAASLGPHSFHYNILALPKCPGFDVFFTRIPASETVE